MVARRGSGEPSLPPSLSLWYHLPTGILRESRAFPNQRRPGVSVLGSLGRLNGDGLGIRSSVSANDPSSSDGCFLSPWFPGCLPLITESLYLRLNADE